MAGCRSTLSMSKIKVRISETKFCSFCKTLDFGLNRYFPFPPKSHCHLWMKDSASTISAVTTFLGQLRTSFVKFSLICSPDKQYNLEAITAVGDLIINLADMFGSLGGIEKGNQIRKGKDYVNKLVVSYSRYGYFT